MIASIKILAIVNIPFTKGSKNREIFLSNERVKVENEKGLSFFFNFTFSSPGEGR